MIIKFDYSEIQYLLKDTDYSTINTSDTKRGCENFYQTNILNRADKYFSFGYSSSNHVSEYSVFDDNKKLEYSFDRFNIAHFEKLYQSKDVEERFKVILKLKDSKTSFESVIFNDYNDAELFLSQVKLKYPSGFDAIFIRGDKDILDYKNFPNEAEIIRKASLSSALSQDVFIVLNNDIKETNLSKLLIKYENSSSENDVQDSSEEKKVRRSRQ
jgi:hypothetical protein